MAHPNATTPSANGNGHYPLTIDPDDYDDPAWIEGVSDHERIRRIAAGLDDLTRWVENIAVSLMELDDEAHNRGECSDCRAMRELASEAMHARAVAHVAAKPRRPVLVDFMDQRDDT